MTYPYTLGRSCSIVLIVLSSRIDLPDVVGFESRQETRKYPCWPVNGDPVEVVGLGVTVTSVARAV